MDYKNYNSPFSWRYGSHDMRLIWSEYNKRWLWRKLWVCLAQVESELGLVTCSQLEDLKNHAGDVDIEKSLQIEAEIQHDLMAEVKVFAEQCPIGGSIIHLGATSMDIKDNAEVIQVQQSLHILKKRVSDLLFVFADKIKAYANTPVMAFTHLQPAEPTTLGYRFSLHAQDLLQDWIFLTNFCNELKAKGFKGAVGTSASYCELFGQDKIDWFENRMSEMLGIHFFRVASQTYPRKQDFTLISGLSGLGLTIYKFAIDLRILQSQPFGELAEPFSEKQVGSSAMPFKRNPIQAEKITSLARYLSEFTQTAWGNAAHSFLERTLDDSANRRVMIPEAFLISDEILLSLKKILLGINIKHNAIKRNLSIYGPFAGTERLLMALVKAGANRQKMHELLRERAMEAWNKVEETGNNDLIARLTNDREIGMYLSGEEIEQMMCTDEYLGNAPQKAVEVADEIFRVLDQS